MSRQYTVKAKFLVKVICVAPQIEKCTLLNMKPADASIRNQLPGTAIVASCNVDPSRHDTSPNNFQLLGIASNEFAYL